MSWCSQFWFVVHLEPHGGEPDWVLAVIEGGSLPLVLVDGVGLDSW